MKIPNFLFRYIIIVENTKIAEALKLFNYDKEKKEFYKDYNINYNGKFPTESINGYMINDIRIKEINDKLKYNIL